MRHAHARNGCKIGGQNSGRFAESVDSQQLAILGAKVETAEIAQNNMYTSARSQRPDLDRPTGSVDRLPSSSHEVIHTTLRNASEEIQPGSGFYREECIYPDLLSAINCSSGLGLPGLDGKTEFTVVIYWGKIECGVIQDDEELQWNVKRPAVPGAFNQLRMRDNERVIRLTIVDELIIDQLCVPGPGLEYVDQLIAFRDEAIHRKPWPVGIRMIDNP